MLEQIGMFGEVKKVVSKSCNGVIYEAGGRAREYRELACNLYTGCDHGCVYCYAPNVLKRKRNEFYGSSQPRTNIIAKVRNDAAYYAERGEERQVLLCFACDPYQAADVQHGITRQAIRACHANGVNICTLTKGGSRALRDLDLFTSTDSFASTLTTLDDAESLVWEPGAALPGDRIATLRKFHEAGIPTWVSLEPVLDPATVYEIIRQTHGFVDEFKVGVLNYHHRTREIDWRKFAQNVQALLEQVGCKYYLKHDLRAYL